MSTADTSRPGRALLFAAWTIVAALLSPWFLSYYFVDGEVAVRGTARRLSLLASGGSVAIALGGLVAHRAAWVRRAQTVGLVLVLATPLVVEGVLRLSFLPAGSSTRSPRSFAWNLVDDDYWLLDARWRAEGLPIVAERVQPELGWGQTDVTPEAPLGLLRESREALRRDGRAKVLFYGDSYVAGESAPENRIPVWMDVRLPSTDVVHLGVGGYGTGQIHMLMERTIDRVDPELVLVGVMIYDLDRTTLEVRTYQKPRLRLADDGGLEVTNLPIEPDPAQFFASRPLRLHSFAAAAWYQKAFLYHDRLRREKEEVNRAILDATLERVERAGAELLYVLFFPRWNLHGDEWRTQFLIDELEARGIPYFDTRGPLLEHVEEQGIKAVDLYNDGHHNDAGNIVIARALLEELRRRGIR